MTRHADDLDADDRDAERERFGDYFAARHGAVRRAAYLLCGDWHWADDLTQTAFIRLAAGWHRVLDPGALDIYRSTDWQNWTRIPLGRQ